MRLNERFIGIGLIAVGGISLLVSWVQGRESVMDEAGQRQGCKVLTVYDGDTLGCDLNENGRIDKPVEEIRLLGVDSPEMHYSRKNPTHDTAHPVDEPFAPEASRWLESRALKKKVYLEFDRKRQDKYERTLAYVYADPDTPASFNQQLLETGYAKVLFLGKNRLHETSFQQTEAAARKSRKGLWGQPVKLGGS